MDPSGLGPLATVIAALVAITGVIITVVVQRERRRRPLNIPDDRRTPLH